MPVHKKAKTDLEAFPQCCICLERDAKVRKLQVCIHTVHYACLKQHFKPECPVCRRKTTEVKVTGTKPSQDFDWELYMAEDTSPINLYSEDEEEEDIDNEVRVVPRGAHHFADEDNEFIRDILGRLSRGHMVGEEELYQMEVALRRSRHEDSSICCLSEEEDGDTSSCDVSSSSEDDLDA